MTRFATALAALVLLAAPAAHGEAAPKLPWTLIAAYPHDRDAFTQGLLLHEGILYESTGLHGKSQVRAVEPTNGRVMRSRALSPTHFGEGLARVDDRLFQLTWQAGEGFIYALDDLRLLGGFRYPGQGWGLAFDGQHLYMSDGSHRLRIIDPEGFREQRRVSVHDNGAPVASLNELEFARGSLFANVWMTDRIARIDPQSGRVTGWLDLTGLLGPQRRGQEGGPDVLNGIAYDREHDHLWVTGKLWPRLFVIRIDAPPGAAR